MFAINGRFQVHNLTGLKRYALELCKLFKTRFQLHQPSAALKGVTGHAWEQFALPVLGRNQLLWSPCNTGPVAAGRHIVTIHDIIPVDHPEWFSRQYSLLYQTLMPLLVRTARHIITDSDHTRTRLIAKLNAREEKVTVIPLGVSPHFSPQSPSDIATVRSSLGLPAGPYALSVCSLEPRKNLRRLISSWSIVRQSLPEATLVLAGASGPSSVFRNADFEIPREGVAVTGYVPEQHLPALYSGASVFVYPSLEEGFGLPVLEAHSCGVPVITSNCSSLPEAASKSAILVDPYSVDEIAAALLKVLAAPKNDLRIRDGIEHALSFNWGRCASATEQLILSHC